MKNLVFLLILFGANCVIAQSRLPVIKATSTKASIRDGAFFDKDGWTLNPKLKLDVYTADRTRETKYITFYTDIDSIKVKLKPGAHFDFVVVLNSRDSFYTRIESAIKENLTARLSSKPDTIPFWLTPDKAIAVKALINQADTVSMHFDLSAFGFRLTKDAIQTKLHSSKINEIATLQIGPRIWQKPDVRSTELTAKQMDGRIGWDVFEGQIVEINYERNLLVVHQTLPGNLNGYRKSKLNFVRSFPCLNGSLVVDGKSYTGDFMLDIGSPANVIVDSIWAATNHLPTNLKVLSTTVLHDPRGVKYETRNVEIPVVRLNGLTSTNVTALMLGNQHPTGFPINLLGNGLLKDFDMIVDFQKDEIYLRKRA